MWSVNLGLASWPNGTRPPSSRSSRGWQGSGAAVPDGSGARPSEFFTLSGHDAGGASSDNEPPSLSGLATCARSLGRSHRRRAEGALADARAWLPERGQLTLGLKCLHAVTAQLADEGIPKEDLKPLLDLEAKLRQMSAPAHSETVSNRRKRRPPSEVLLARVAALIDLLIKAGSDEVEAAQIMMRKLVAPAFPRRNRGATPAGGDVSCNGAPSLVTGLSRREPSRNI